jgi:hypothetical protein
MLVFGMASLALGGWWKGETRPRLNRLELIDVDTITQRARGIYWGTLYSPTTEQFELSLKTASLDENSQSSSSALLSWWGLPGAGIGGMNAEGTDFRIIPEAYHHGEKLESLERVPILTSSTKSLMARWTSAVGPLVEAQLADDNGLVSGTIVNRTGRLLRNVRLMYGGWGYRLGNLEAGGRLDVGDHLDSHRVKTIVGSASLAGSPRSAADTTLATVEGASPLGLLNLMMFYEAAGGEGFAKLPNRYLAYCDLSRHLDLGRAILVADLDAQGSRLMEQSGGEPLGEDGDFGAVVVRFVLPVIRNEIER